MNLYKIVRADGLFSKGGVDALTHNSKWGKNGKVWNSLGAVKNHLRLVEEAAVRRKCPIPDDWMVVVYSVVPSNHLIKAKGLLK